MGDKPAVSDRDTLYAEVWTEPVKIVTARYGISDVALAKTCRKLQIPLPGRGYWAKNRAGTASPRPPLPVLSEEASRRTQWSNVRRSQLGRPMVVPKKDEISEPRPGLQVADRLKRPHKLVVEARELLEGPGSRGDFAAFGDKACLDIWVSRGSLRRALLIMDALIKGFEEHEHDVEVTEPSRAVSHYNSPDLVPGVTRGWIGDDWIHFGLREGYTKVQVHRPLEWAAEWGGYSIDWVRRPTGRFSLFITNAPPGFRTSWNDGKKQRVEDCLGAFVAYLPLVSRELKGQRIESERRHQEWLEQEKLRREAEARRLEEERRRKELSEALGKWRLAGEIRAFVAEVQKADLASRKWETLQPELRERRRRALEYAESMDPIPGLIAPPSGRGEDQ